MSRKNFIKVLTVRLELITYAVVVPFVCIFVIFVNGFNLKESFYFLVGALAGIVFTLLTVPVVRYFHLMKMFSVLELPADKRNPEELAKLKADLLNFPINECYYVSIQWAIGVPIAAFASSHFLNYELKHYVSYLVSFLMIFFINMVTHFFTCEIIIGSELAKDHWDHVPTKNVKNISMHMRIFISILSVVWLCFFMFGYMVYVENQAVIHLENMFVYFPILGLQLLVLAGLVTYLFSHSTSKNTKDLITNLIDLSEGRLGAKSPMISSDEIGSVKESLNHFNYKLSEIIRDIEKESDRLLQFSNSLKLKAKATTDLLIEQSASTEQMSAASKGLSHSASGIIQKTHDQMKQMERSMDSLKLLTAKIQEIAVSSSDAALQSETMEALAQSGNEKIQVSIDHMGAIREITLKIQGISSLVSEIADRVGLLSLNASIEAARAGESGRGFAVVAQEISKLGESTQKSSKEIDTLVNQAVKVVSLGTHSMEDLKHAMSTILLSVEDSILNIKKIQGVSGDQATLSKVVSENSTALFDFTKVIVNENQEQAMVLKQIIEAVETVAENTNYLVTAAEENQNLANDLQDQSSKLNRTIGFFQSK